NGEAIYDTRPFAVFGEGPTKASANSTERNHDIQTYTAEDVRYTVPKDPNSHILYATALGWPAGGGKLLLHTLYAGNPYQPGGVCSVELLGAPGDLGFEQLAYGLA